MVFFSNKGKLMSASCRECLLCIIVGYSAFWLAVVVVASLL